MKRFIDLESIVIPEGRQRKEFDENANQDLIASIQSVGLLQAPVLEFDGECYVLRAGERRVRAIQDIYALGGSFSYDGEPVIEGLVPHTLWTELTELQRLEIEVDENNCRVPFTWQEKAKATEKLTRLRMMQADNKSAPQPTVADIALEVRGSDRGSAHNLTRNELILAKHLHKPEIAAAKTPKEAMSILKKVEQADYHKRLGEIAGKTYSVADHICVQADSEDWAMEQPAGLFDVICTDPPYGIGADNFGEADDSRARAHEYEDSAETLQAIMKWFPVAAYRLAKPEAHLYLFCDIDWFPEWKDRLTSAGWEVFRTPIIWHRPTGFRTPWINKGPQRKYETIVYAVKGDKPVNMIAPDCFTLQSCGEGLGYSAAKPWEVYAELLRRSVKPGDTVADLFCGSGPIFRAATELKCLATGVEKTALGYGISLAQLKKLQPAE